MATYHAISAIGQAIVSILKTARPASLPGIDIKLFQAKEVQSVGEWEGVSLVLYRTTISGARRQMPQATAANGKLLKRPLPVDLFYLITPWAKTAEMAHLLLGWAMRTLEDSLSLPAALLNASFPNVNPFRASETVDLIHDSLTNVDLNNIWEVLGKHNMQVSAGYVVRVVPIDSELELPDSAPVQTRRLDAGQAALP